MRGWKNGRHVFLTTSYIFWECFLFAYRFHYFHHRDYKSSRHYSIDMYQPSKKCAVTGPHSLWFLGSPHCTSFRSILVQSCLHIVCPFHYDPFTLMSVTWYLLFWFVEFKFGHIWSTDLQFLVWDMSCLDIFLSLIGKSYCTFSTKPHQVCGQINGELILTTKIIRPKRLINNKMLVCGN